MSAPVRVAVIGGGVTGLCAAHRLATEGHEVIVFEAAEVVGGLASGFTQSSWEWPLERFYHHLFESDACIRGLTREIGMGDRLFFRRPATTQWWHGKAYPLDSASAILRFPGMPVKDRIRFGAALAYLKFAVNNWQALEKTTATRWSRRVFGRRAYDALLQPLLEGKFGPGYEEVNMAWLWARFKARTPRLGYFEGGFQAFVDALGQAASNKGAAVITRALVDELAPRPGGGWIVRTGGEAHAVDAVISTTSPGLLARMTPELPPDYLASLSSLRSLGAVVVTLALSRELTGGAYWVNVPKRQFPFLAVVEHTNFISPEHYGGQRLVYCGDYVDAGHEYFSLSLEEMLERFLPALVAINADFDRSWVLGAWMHREKYAQPIVPVNHSRNIPAISTPLSGLFWASMSHVYPWDRGTNFAVELGEKAAAEVIRQIQTGSVRPAAPERREAQTGQPAKSS